MKQVRFISSTWLSCESPFSTLPDVKLLAHEAKRKILTLTIWYSRQWFNLMAVRTRRLSIFQHPPAFNKYTQNLRLFPAMAFALCIAVFWLYVPALQNVLGTTSVPAENYFLPAAFGLGVLSLDEARKAAVRRWPNGFLAKIAW